MLVTMGGGAFDLAVLTVIRHGGRCLMSCLLSGCIGAMLTPMSLAAANTQPLSEQPVVVEQHNETAEVFAVVGGEVITNAQFHAYAAENLRKRFYHGNVSQAQLNRYQQEVAQQFIDRVLLRQEASRQAVSLDQHSIDTRLAELTQHGAKVDEEGITFLRSRLEEDALLEGLKQKTKNGEAPTEQQVRDYYRRNAEKFTRPEQLRISLVLLPVPPYAAAKAWETAFKEAQRLVARIEQGEAFEEIAQQYSGHESAQQGGDLGYVHAGMLSEEVQDVVDQLKPGQLTEPVVLLQGVAVIRLDERIEPRLNAYEKVSERARRLLLKERGEMAWQDLIAKLRETTPIKTGEGSF